MLWRPKMLVFVRHPSLSSVFFGARTFNGRPTSMVPPHLSPCDTSLLVDWPRLAWISRWSCLHAASHSCSDLSRSSWLPAAALTGRRQWLGESLRSHFPEDDAGSTGAVGVSHLPAIGGFKNPTRTKPEISISVNRSKSPAAPMNNISMLAKGPTLKTGGTIPDCGSGNGSAWAWGTVICGKRSSEKCTPLGIRRHLWHPSSSYSHWVQSSASS